MGVRYSTKYLKKFIQDEEYKNIYSQVKTAHELLESKTGLSLIHIFRHLTRRAGVYLLPLSAFAVFVFTVQTVVHYNYILAVYVNDQIVGYVESENVFDQAKEDVQQRVESANIATGDASRQLEIKPTFALAVQGEVLDENAMADAILTAASDEIQEATALYVDGDLAAITTDGEDLREDLEAIKEP